MSATIEIKSKILFGNISHMYLVYTNEAGEQRILIGGPEGSNIMGALLGDVYVQDMPYIPGNIDYQKNDEPLHQHYTMFTGTDAEMLAKISLARAEMQLINS